MRSPCSCATVSTSDPRSYPPVSPETAAGLDGGALAARNHRRDGIVEGDTYYPPDWMRARHFRPTDHIAFGGWKGAADYFSVDPGDELAENAAWTYHEPEPKAANIKGFAAFYPIVTVAR